MADDDETVQYGDVTAWVESFRSWPLDPHRQGDPSVEEDMARVYEAAAFLIRQQAWKSGV
jgi:hypothetical protein